MRGGVAADEDAFEASREGGSRPAPAERKRGEAARDDVAAEEAALTEGEARRKGEAGPVVGVEEEEEAGGGVGRAAA